MTQKRTHINLDPDYEDVSDVQSKRRRVLEEGAKEATKRKIENIIRKQFDNEIQTKQNEIIKISETLEKARNVMDRLRAVIVANYYGNACQQKSAKVKASLDQAPVIHPAVKKFIGKAPPGTPHLPAAVKQEPALSREPASEVTSERIGKMPVPVAATSATHTGNAVDWEQADSRTGRFRMKRRIIVGNVSKSIPADQRDENDQATHKWMVYVRGSKNRPQIDDFVKKIWFFLHPSYRPNDLVEVSHPPFHLTRRGWGEFPVRVQIHFKDSRNKKLDIIHNLKLDRTYTGLQTLGTETVVDMEIERDLSGVQQQKNKDSTCNSGQLSFSVKHEPEVTESVCNQTVSQVVQNIKSEPMDHDYGRSSCSVSIQGSEITVKSEPSELSNACVTTSSSTVSVFAAPSQSVVRPSVVMTQAISLVPLPSGTIINSPNKCRISPRASPVKDQLHRVHVLPPALSSAKNVFRGLQQISISSPSVLLSSSSSPSQLAKPVAVCSSSVPSVVSLTSLSVSSSSSAIPVAQNSFVTRANSSVTSNTNLNSSPASANISPVIQTGLRLPGSQIIQQNRQPGNQSTNPGLVFLKCTDNQGKTYLIPQQVCTSLSPSSKSQPSTPVKAGSQAIFVGQNKVIGQNISSPQQPLVQLVSTTNTQKTAKNVQGVQNGPVLFIKPEGSVSKNSPQSVLTTRSATLTQNATSVKLPSAANTVQIVRGIGQNQGMRMLNVKVPSQSAVNEEKQSVVKGQLVVTSQGLIQVPGQTNSATIRAETTNGEKSAPSQVKQPIVLVPTSSKSIGFQGKTKSLLSPVVNNLTVSHSSGNIIVLNQSASLLANGNVPRTLSTVSSNQSRVSSVQSTKASIVHKENVSQHERVVLQASNQSKTVNSFAPNHLVIIPVTSEKAVTMTTMSQSISSTPPTLAVSNSGRLVSTPVSGSVMATSAQKNDKTMFIVVQNDKGPNSTAQVNKNADGKKSMSSLLTSRTVPSSNVSSMKQDFSETQVMLTSKNNKQKQIILVNKHESLSDSTTSDYSNSRVGEKKIIDLKKKKLNLVPEEDEIIPPLCISSYQDMLSLIQAALVRHPLVSKTTGQSLHPYCAKSRDIWLSWSLGKRRASEWQRASWVRRFIRSYLDEGTMFKGEPLWSIKQIVVWCRLHAYSPHYLERPLHPTGIDLQSETSLVSEKQHRNFSSLSNCEGIMKEVTSLQEMMTSAESSDEEVDIESDVMPSRQKVEKRVDVPEPSVFVDNLPPTEGALFISKATNQIGLKFEPTEIEPGYFGTLSHGILYKAMERFMGDLLRKTFALQVNMGRYPDALGVADVYQAVNHLPITDFLTNKHLGVEDPVNGQSHHR